MASGKVTDMKTKLARLNGLKKEVQGGTSSPGRIRVKREKNLNNDNLYDILEQIIEARVNHKSLKAAEKEAKYSAEKVVATYEEWRQKFPHRKNSALMAHGKNILLPVGEYYNARFTYEDGDCYKMREMLEAAQILIPYF